MFLEALCFLFGISSRSLRPRVKRRRIIHEGSEKHNTLVNKRDYFGRRKALGRLGLQLFSRKWERFGAFVEARGGRLISRKTRSLAATGVACRNASIVVPNRTVFDSARPVIEWTHDKTQLIISAIDPIQ